MRKVLLSIAVLATLTGTAVANVVRTDGKSDIQVAAAGNATCRSATPAEAAHALAVTNAARAAKGLQPMRLNARAQRAAEKHACEMAMRGVMTHAGTKAAGPSARMKAEGYRPRLVAENIAAGRFTLERTVQEWSASPGHLANIVIPRVRDFGVGYAVGADGRTIFYAAVYGQPR